MKSKKSKKRLVKEIEFDAEVLLKSLRGHADHLEGKRKLIKPPGRLTSRT